MNIPAEGLRGFWVGAIEWSHVPDLPPWNV